MANGIVTRLVRLFKAHTHDAIDAIEDPSAVARQVVRDMDSEIEKCQKVAVSVGTDRNVMVRLLEDTRKEAETWNAKAAKAFKSGQEDLAKKALSYAVQAEKRQAGLEKSLSLLNPKLDDLKARIEALQRRRQDTEHQLALLDARSKMSQATSKVVRALADIGFNDSNSTSDIERRVGRQEAEADALNEMLSPCDDNEEISVLVSSRLESIKRNESA